MANDDGGPAFPQTKFYREGETAMGEAVGGLSLRDWFAGQVIIGMLTGHNPGNVISDKDYADEAYMIADAMIVARKRWQNPA